MRIGIVGLVYPDSFADNLISALAVMGHEPIPLGAALPSPTSRWASKAMMTLARSLAVAEHWQRRLIRTAQEQNLDLTISVHAPLLPSSVAALGAGERKVALWFPDHVANIDRQLMLVAPYDAVFFKDRLLVQRLNALTDAPVYYLPEACNPAWHRSSERTAVDPVILVAGNLYPSRALLLERLHREGIPLRLHSSGWPRWFKGRSVQSLPVLPEVRREEKARSFRRAAAVLNNLHPAEMNGVNCRLFEAAGCGAVVLAESRPVLRECFEPDSEVLDFTTFDELMDRIRYTLQESEAATKIGDAAAARAHSEHTYMHRLEEMFRILGC